MATTKEFIDMLELAIQHVNSEREMKNAILLAIQTWKEKHAADLALTEEEAPNARP